LSQYSQVKIFLPQIFPFPQLKKLCDELLGVAKLLFVDFWLQVLTNGGLLGHTYMSKQVLLSFNN